MTKEFKGVLVGAAILATVGVIIAIVMLVNSGPSYAQNANPDYQSFAHSYASKLEVYDELAIQITMPLSKELGDTICTKLREGVTEKQLTDRLTGTGSEDHTLDRVQAASVVNAAHNYICSGK